MADVFFGLCSVSNNPMGCRDDVDNLALFYQGPNSAAVILYYVGNIRFFVSPQSLGGEDNRRKPLGTIAVESFCCG